MSHGLKVSLINKKASIYGSFWLTLSTDFPVMPVEVMTVTLKPANFFSVKSVQ